MRRDWSHLFPLISIFLLFTALSYGQAWSGILASSRAINWGNAGLPATLPDGETTPNPWTPPTRTQCVTAACGAVSAGTVTVASINAALASAPTGTYVLLPPGTFTLSGANNCFGGSATCIQFYAVSGVTLRGSGAQSTKLVFSGNAMVAFGIVNSNGSGVWSAGYSQGTTALTMSSYSGPALVAGSLAVLAQCDTGYSGSTCGTGSSTDNGGAFICGPTLGNCTQQTRGDTPNHQRQTVYVTSVTGSGPYTVNISPGLYMQNWSSSNSPTITWEGNLSAGPYPYGDGIEDLTLDMTASTWSGNAIGVDNTYASWIKGTRILGIGTGSAVYFEVSKNCLFANNYMFSNALVNSDIVSFQTGTSSDNLILNNILTGMISWEGTGANTGNVLAYNYGNFSETSYYQNADFEHEAGSAFRLDEGNQIGIMTVGDDTWGTDNLNTFFRNYVPGFDPPYTSTVNPRAFTVNSFQRFYNIIGNAIGSSLITNYSTGPWNYAYSIGSDALTGASLMRWGNCDTATNTCRFQSSEVPTTLTGSAISFENAVPSGTASDPELPCSFFLAGYTSTTCTPHPSGGTGLSWWKVCTSWTTFPTNCATTELQPFPAAGPDVSGGPYVNGTAYDIPSAIAFKNLPIDSSYQNSYGITGSSWSGGTETLTISGFPTTSHIIGGFQITGVSACNSAAGAEFVMTGSTLTTVSYALASNPGSCAGGTMKFPDVRQFDERVYENDTSGNNPPPAPTGLQATVH